MSRIELGAYIPEIKAEVIELQNQQDKAFDSFCAASAVSLTSASIIAAVCIIFLAMNAPETAANLTIALAPAPGFIGGTVALVIYAIKVVKLTNKIDDANVKTDRSEDLQNEANRIWVKRELFKSMADNNNDLKDFDQKLQVIDEKFGIRPNVNSEEEYLSYWANSKKQF